MSNSQTRWDQKYESLSALLGCSNDALWSIIYLMKKRFHDIMYYFWVYRQFTAAFSFIMTTTTIMPQS
uniref:Putative ovule protein n=1 Tax=Solanum chacoense TaxID=4108 RepID=A0A0V0GWT2_SOLCH